MTETPQIKNVAIIGVGVMGSLVAWACAVNGLETNLYDLSPEQLRRAMEKLKMWFFDGRLSKQDAQACLGRLHPYTSLEEALANVDLAFENVPEDLELKRKVLAEIGRLAHPRVLMGSNASSITCSPLAEASGRPDRFFNMNFSDPRYESLVELMGNPRTAESTMRAAKEWARAIKMVPVVTKKEIMGYTNNRIWRAIKKEALFLANEGYADFEDIDRAFMLMFGTAYGPFGRMDTVSLDSIQKVEWQYYEASRDENDKPPKILNDLVEAGHLGEKTGKGFYTYPNPAYKQAGWLRMEPPWDTSKKG